MLNNCSIMGRLTRDPEIRQTKGGDPLLVAKFGLAVERDYTTEQGEKITDFIEIVAWRKKAEFAEKYLKKGQLVAIQGSLYRNDWETRDGEKRSYHYIEAKNIYFAESKKNAPEKEAVAEAPTETPADSGYSNGFDPFADDGFDPFA